MATVCAAHLALRIRARSLLVQVLAEEMAAMRAAFEAQLAEAHEQVRWQRRQQ